MVTHFVSAVRYQRQTMVKITSPHTGCVADIPQSGSLMAIAVEKIEIGPNQGVQCLRSMRRYRQRYCWKRIFRIEPRYILLNRVLYHHKMRVCSPKSKRIYSGNRRPRSFRPCFQIDRHPQLQIFEWNSRIRVMKVQIRRNHPVLERQGDFNNPGYSCCSLQVSNIGFYRSDHALSTLSPTTGQYISDSHGLNWDPNLCPCPMSLDIIHVTRSNPRLAVNLS